MTKQLWGDKPHSQLAALDSASLLEKLKNSKLALKLITEKPSLKTPIQIVGWIKRAMALLGSAISLAMNENEDIQYLFNFTKGAFDDTAVNILFVELDIHVDKLKDSDQWSERVAELAHSAISHWAELEVKANVSE